MEYKFLKITILIAIISPYKLIAKSTNPSPPKITNYSEDISRINLSDQIPDPPDKYEYVVKGDINGKKIYSKNVPLWKFGGTPYKTQAGVLPIGSKVKLERVMVYMGMHYYGIEDFYTIGKKKFKRYIWLEGSLLKIVK